MPKIKTHSGAKKRFKLSKNGKPIEHMPTSLISLPKRTQREREIFARHPLPIQLMLSRLNVSFLINNRSGLYTAILKHSEVTN